MYVYAAGTMTLWQEDLTQIDCLHQLLHLLLLLRHDADSADCFNCSPPVRSVQGLTLTACHTNYNVSSYGID